MSKIANMGVCGQICDDNTCCMITLYFLSYNNNNNKLFLLRVKPYKLLKTYLPKGPLG